MPIHLSIHLSDVLRLSLMKVLADVAHSFTMESGPGGRRGRHSHSTGLLYPSWRRRTNYLQGALTFIIFTAHFQWGASQRNETLVLMTDYGAWNKTLYKIERRCSLFHDNATQSYFYYWPEDDPDFRYCCSANESIDLFKNFTYGKYGPHLTSAPYYDLGLIDQYLPFWRCFRLFERMYGMNSYKTNCETTDLMKLYKRRFFSDTLFKRGLLQSALPLILFSEILVIFIALYMFIRPRPLNESRDIMVGASTAAMTWLRRMRKTVLMDWTHLYLLAMIGNGLIDAVGRQDPFQPQSRSFYNYGRLYIVLWILVACSSVLHQITSWIAQMDESISSLHASKAVELEEKIGLNDDWKWQPIAAQLGILFCLSGFLTYPNPDKDTAGPVVGIVVGAACPWSGLYIWWLSEHVLYCIQ